MPTTTTKSPPASVLYVDHAGHPAPLSLSYHATASRLLSSSIDDRRPPSTLTEVDTAYCPQCLSFHDAAAASGQSLRGTCPKPTCRSCPVCASILTIVLEESRVEGEDGLVCMYSCGYCRWTSEECGVTVKVEGEKVDADVIAGATDMLLYEVEKRVGDGGGGKDADRAFKGLVEKWGKKAQEEERRLKQQGSFLPTQRRVTSNIVGGSGSKLWSIETLEDSTREKREKAKSADDAAMENMSRLNFDSDDDDNDKAAAAKSKTNECVYLTDEQIAKQSIVSPLSSVDGSHVLLPVPIQFRPRKSRRCRAELADGRTGILVKPKFNPLEGDSSLRSGHGQWYKKDSSAVHVVPSVKVIKHGHQDGIDSAPAKHALLLMVKNPTLGTIRLRLNGIKDSADKSGLIDPSELENVIIDPMKRTRVDADICLSASSLEPTEVMELDPVEDAFLELGKGQSRDPPEVEGWESSSVLGSDRGTSAKVVATQNDKAWVDVVVLENAVDDSTSSRTDRYLAAHIALQIEVGEGSWESSLIKPLPVGEGERDFVTLNLVVVWTGQS